MDVVERLAGMIRAAIGGEAAGAGPERPSVRAAKGFIVNGQMTSLTGCSGEHFASILRSLGFRAVEMRRSEFFGSPSANEPPEQREASAAPEAQAASDPASSPTARSEEAAEPMSAAPVEPPPDAVLEDAAAEGAEAAEMEGAEAEGAEVESADAEGALAEGTEAAGPDPEEAEAESAEAEEAEADGALSAVSADPSDGAVGEGAEAAASQPQGAGGERTRQADDVVIVWRPERRRVWPNREKGSRQAKNSNSGPPRRPDIDGQAPVQTPKRSAGRPSKPNRFDSPRSDEKRRQRPSEYGMSRSNPTTAPQQKAKVDPNSPFAKLLELRPLLEEQTHKRP